MKIPVENVFRINKMKKGEVKMKHEFNYRDWDNSCPVCGSDNLSVANIQTDLSNDLLYEFVVCKDCYQIIQLLYDVQLLEIHYEASVQDR
jgi:transcription elongation factor Elf1